MSNAKAIIITDNWWFAADFPRLYLTKKILLITSAQDLKTYLQGKNNENISLVTNNLNTEGVVSRFITLNKKYALQKEHKNNDLSNLYLININVSDLKRALIK